MPEKTITVVIPTYNCAEYLPDCLESLEKQTVRDQMEIIIVDDGSTDDTATVLSEWSDKVDQIISLPKNKGANAARNVGLSLASGKYVSFADADAVYYERWAQELSNALDSSIAGVAYCYWHRRENLKDQDEPKEMRLPAWSTEKLWWDELPIPMPVMFRRSMLPPKLPEDSKFRDDWKLVLDLASRGHSGKLVCDFLFLAYLRLEGKTKQMGLDYDNIATSRAAMRRKHFDLSRLRGPVNVIIPGYGCGDITVECLNHLTKYSGVPLHIIYVDNGSSKEDCAKVATALCDSPFSHQAIWLEENQGFSYAINLGLKYAGQESPVLLLNTDAMVAPECIERMLKYQRIIPRFGIVGPLTSDTGHQSLYRMGGAGSDWGEHLQPARDALPDILETSRRLLEHHFIIDRPMIAMCCCVISPECLKAVGHLDAETFPDGLGSDDDFSFRAINKGFQPGLALDAFCMHGGGITFTEAGIDREERQKVAIEKVLEKHPSLRSFYHPAPVG